MPSFEAEELALWSAGRWLSQPVSAVTGISKDTRTISSGDLYVALAGENYDGHDFLQKAFEKGASAAMISALPADDMPGACLVVDDTMTGLGGMAVGYRRKVGPEVVVVTGSAGKTTVKEMSARILSSSMTTACTVGNLNNNIGVPLSLLAMPSDAKIGVFEVGMNHPGELLGLCDMLSPTWGVVTNIGPAHIEYFDDLEGIAEEKATVLRCLPSDGGAVLDADDPFFSALRQACPCPLLTTSLGGAADYVGIRGEKLTVREARTGDECRIDLRLPGEHQARNALMAVAIGRSHGVSWRSIEDTLSAYESLPMRWKVVSVGSLVIVDDSYNANPLSMRAAVTAFEAQYAAKRRWLVLGDMLELGDRSNKSHDEIGRMVGSGDSHGLVLVGEQARRIGDAAQEAGYRCEGVFECATAEEASDVLIGHVSGDDAILLKASRNMGLDRVVELISSDRSSCYD